MMMCCLNFTCNFMLAQLITIITCIIIIIIKLVIIFILAFVKQRVKWFTDVSTELVNRAKR